MRYQKISVLDKQRLVDAHNRGEDYVALARQLDIKRTTAYAIIRRAEENDGVVALPRGGARPQRRRVSPELAEAAVNIVEEHPEFTLDQINSELRTVLPAHAHIGRSTLSSMLHGELIVMKKLEDAPIQRNSEEVKNRRKEFAEWILQAMNKELVFIDEAGINLYTQRTRGRARVGERAVRVVGGTRGRNFTMTFAASATNGLVYHQLISGGMNGERFKEFLREVVEHLPDNGVEKVLLFDNAPAHRCAADVELPVNVSLRWLPPYSPMLNIVEQCFSQWKATVKRCLAEVRDQLHEQTAQQKEATLSQLAEQSVSVVTVHDCANYFSHLQSYLPPSLLKQDILM